MHERRSKKVWRSVTDFSWMISQRPCKTNNFHGTILTCYLSVCTQSSARFARVLTSICQHVCERKCTGREPPRREHPIPPLLFCKINHAKKSEERAHSVANELNILSPSHLTECLQVHRTLISHVIRHPFRSLASTMSNRCRTSTVFNPLAALAETCLKFERPGWRQHLGSEPSIPSSAKEEDF